MRKLIYKLAHVLYKAHILPWALWSPVYDRFHGLLKIEDRY